MSDTTSDSIQEGRLSAGISWLRGFECSNTRSSPLSIRKQPYSVASSNTTATSMRAIMLQRISNQKIYNWLQREIDEHIERGLISSRILDEGSRNLQACIKKGVRRNAQRRQKEICTRAIIYHPTLLYESMDGFYSSILSLGPAAAIFRPKRRMKTDPAQAKAMSQVQKLVLEFGRTTSLNESDGGNESKHFPC